MDHDDVESAIISKLVTLTGLPHIVYPNVAYTPVEGTPYGRFTNIPGKTGSYSIGTNDPRYDGIAQIDLFYPVGVGRSAAMTMANNVATHFTAGTALTDGNVCLTTEPPYLLTSYNDGAWYVVPVRVPYFGG